MFYSDVDFFKNKFHLDRHKLGYINSSGSRYTAFRCLFADGFGCFSFTDAECIFDKDIIECDR